MKKILMILTSHQKMENTDTKTGVWLGEFTDPYYTFIDKGYEVTLASPEGGTPPIDALSSLTQNITSSNRRFEKDASAQKAFNNTIPIEKIKASDFDAVFFPGGHGPLWDLASNEISGRIILDFLDQKKHVASVCHGVAALIKAEELQPGLLKNKKMTGFSNAEETLVLRNENIPYKLETRLKELGADYQSAIIPFSSHLEDDGLMITGQNPLSAGPAAHALINALEKKTSRIK